LQRKAEEKTMKAMVDISAAVIGKAYAHIQKKKGTCKILPRARFKMCDWDTEFSFDCLVCSPLMGDKQTGIAAEHCRNCALKRVSK
jgi:hypothetical protein